MPRKKGEIHPDAIAFIVYPEQREFNNDNQSEYDFVKNSYEAKAERIIEIFQEHCFKGFISPLHEPEGDDKKYHFHVMLIFPKRRGLSISSYREIVNICDGANGHVEALSAPHEYARYLIHNGEKYKDKKLYFPHQVKEIGISYQEYSNIFDYEADILEDSTSLLISIISYVDTYGIVLFSDLVNYCIEAKPLWLPVVKKNIFFIKEYMRSMEYSKRYIDNERKSVMF